MKTKEFQTLKEKTKVELFKEIAQINEEIARLQLEFKSNPPKDVNQISNKRRKLAVMLTIAREK